MSLKSLCISQTWWCKNVISTLARQKGDCQNSEASLGYIASLSLRRNKNQKTSSHVLKT